MPEAKQSPLDRLHERLDQLLSRQSEIQADVATIKANCGPCRAAIDKHDATLYGNGQPGLVTTMAVTREGRTDTLRVKSVIVLMAAVGTLASVVSSAMAILVKLLVH